MAHRHVHCRPSNLDRRTCTHCRRRNSSLRLPLCWAISAQRGLCRYFRRSLDQSGPDSLCMQCRQWSSTHRQSAQKQHRLCNHNKSAIRQEHGTRGFKRTSVCISCGVGLPDREAPRDPFLENDARIDAPREGVRCEMADRAASASRTTVQVVCNLNIIVVLMRVAIADERSVVDATRHWFNHDGG